jgi:hypothetical protein
MPMLVIFKPLQQRWLQRRQARSAEGLLDVDFIMSEIRRARRFDIPFSVALFLEPRLESDFELHDLARRMDAELREFDYVAVNEAGSFIALWMFGTPREGAKVKAERLRAAPALSSILSDSRCGLATFPHDGMTYEALMETARGDALADGPRPIEIQAVMQEKARWSQSRSNQQSESTSTS